METRTHWDSGSRHWASWPTCMWGSDLGISAPATSTFHVYPQRTGFAGFFAGPLGMALTL